MCNVKPHLMDYEPLNCAMKSWIIYDLSKKKNSAAGERGKKNVGVLIDIISFESKKVHSFREVIFD